MKKFTFILTLIFLYAGLFTAKGQCANEANIFSFAFDGKNYEVVKELKTWETAAACAVERGGYLVHINSAGEQSAVYNAITNGAAIPNDYTDSPDGGSVAYVWIGATDKAEEGTWLWDGDNDGNGVHFYTGIGYQGGAAIDDLYINWGLASTGPAEPDNFANQDAAGIGLAPWPEGSGEYGQASQWNDINVSNQLYFVIEYESGSSINQTHFDNEIVVYPNPAYNEISVKSAKNYNLTITNILGQTLITKRLNNNNETLDIQSLQKGYYIVRLQNKSFSKTFNIKKQ